MGWYPEAGPAERAASYLSDAGLDYEADRELPALLALARRGDADFSVLNRLLDHGDLFHLDVRMVAAGFGMCLFAGLVAGLYPAWRVCRVAPATHLKMQ